ncbi:unnamed protein product [Ceutorhynchus assimilis]|uniref:Peptidase A2 domain-containing protein n=1 Tax=Ceutorhynchus assimilis TaxID=467358 RepID=A0A9N9MCC9_9CUCU|nr:unnamed protein product [Ceutorhynchus assimilis]
MVIGVLELLKRDLRINLRRDFSNFEELMQVSVLYENDLKDINGTDEKRIKSTSNSRPPSACRFCVNNKQIKALLDTGASDSFLNRRFALSNNLTDNITTVRLAKEDVTFKT